MISVIICSRKPSALADLYDNISNTIGSEYEVITIDNSKNTFSIFSAYNEGVDRAKGDILCFMHEDITYHSNNWGIEVENFFLKSPKRGLLGVFGECALPSRPSYLWNLTVNYYIQQEGEILAPKNWRKELYNGEGLCNVLVVDGMWFCIPKRLFQNEIKFDDSYFKGFHMYDMDISLQIVTSGYECYVTNKVQVCHHNDVLSSCNESFGVEINRLFLKWNKYFPMVTIKTFYQLRILLALPDDYSNAFKKTSTRALYKVLKKVKVLINKQ